MRSRAATMTITLSLAGWLYSTVGVVAAPEEKAPTAVPTPAKDDSASAKALPAKKEYKSPYPNRTNFFEPVETAVEQALSAAQPAVHSRQTTRDGRLRTQRRRLSSR